MEAFGRAGPEGPCLSRPKLGKSDTDDPIRPSASGSTNAQPEEKGEARGAGFTCAMCLEPVRAKSRLALGCGHQFHSKCMGCYARVEASEGRFRVRCPMFSTGCHAILQDADLIRCLPQDEWRVFECRRAELSSVVHEEVDPQVHCEMHAKGFRRCPRCGVYIQKLEGGCDKLTCRCGCKFCFQCGALHTELAGCSCTAAFHNFISHESVMNNYEGFALEHLMGDGDLPDWVVRAVVADAANRGVLGGMVADVLGFSGAGGGNVEAATRAQGLQRGLAGLGVLNGEDSPLAQAFAAFHQAHAHMGQNPPPFAPVMGMQGVASSQARQGPGSSATAGLAPAPAPPLRPQFNGLVGAPPPPVGVGGPTWEQLVQQVAVAAGLQYQVPLLWEAQMHALHASNAGTAPQQHTGYRSQNGGGVQLFEVGFSLPFQQGVQVQAQAQAQVQAWARAQAQASAAASASAASASAAVMSAAASVPPAFWASTSESAPFSAMHEWRVHSDAAVRAAHEAGMSTGFPPAHQAYPFGRAAPQPLSSSALSGGGVSGPWANVATQELFANAAQSLLEAMPPSHQPHHPLPNPLTYLGPGSSGGGGGGGANPHIVGVHLPGLFSATELSFLSAIPAPPLHFSTSSET